MTREKTLGSSPTFKTALGMAERAASGRSAGLIIGPTGSGKSHIARFIHSTGPASGRPFMEWNAGAVPKELFEAELFGVASGTATGVSGRAGVLESVADGTLCFAGLELLDSARQASLLRILDERAFTRVGRNRRQLFRAQPLASFSRWPEDLVRSGLLRRDLLFRFDIIRIKLPPLNERLEDIPLLAKHFLNQACQNQNTAVPQMTAELLEALKNAPWPGNLRELKQRMEGLALSGRSPLTPEELPAHFWIDGTPVQTGTREKMTLEELKNAYIRSVLAECGGNRTRSARILGISRKTLWEYLKRNPS